MISESVARSVVKGGDTEYTPVERITNGGFANASGWTIEGATWVIGGGVATNVSDGTIRQTLVTGSVLPSGGSIQVSFDVGGVQETIFVFTYIGGVKAQQLYGQSPLPGTVTINTTATAEWDTVAFEGFIATGLTIDNVSVIA